MWLFQVTTATVRRKGILFSCFVFTRKNWEDHRVLEQEEGSQKPAPNKRSCVEIFLQYKGLITIKEAHDIEARLNEVEKLLKTIINMPWKYSRSEVVLTFFERSPLDQVLKNDNVHKIQPSFQSPVKISEIMRSNGFCLANTETIVIDHSIPNGKEKHLDVDSAEHLFESVSDFTSELEDSDDPTAYVTNLTYYHLVPFETDILD
ncbi:PX domain-containing protein 1 isoform X2 [Harpia harpyja]|uniref:PX domain-containing protein 1 isoform X2 n=1 Tax=Aquila chrysaetos chrysaetos TaxID=223781 RepID=UPI0011767282|nr:PX domain-containing protein 1 isoform X2 [Aquila chrysaetos chrysaetos]XP_052636007.1 PX domain-containing protein 1 isoform X2 [Harpia harpyja]